MKLISKFAVALTISACASSSGVFKVGPETFTISTSASHGRGGIPAAKQIAYQEANEECTKRGLEVFALSEKTASQTWTDGMTHMDLNFRCLRPDDKEFQRQRLQSSPDQIIENRQR